MKVSIPRLLLAFVFGLCTLTGHLQAAESPIRNVLFIISDDLKASVLGCYGNKVCRTPNIDSLAESGLLFERTYCQGTVCGPSRTSLMRSRYQDKNGLTLGEHLIDNDIHSARVSKIFHMRVPGDIIPGTNGRDVPDCWDERYNVSGQEAHTPGLYACLNLNIFTRELEGRQSTRMPHRMFVSVRYEGDGSDQPDYKAADKTIELLREHQDKPFFIATGFVRPHYPSVAPEKYFQMYPYEEMELPEQVENDLEDIPRAGWANSRSDTTGLSEYPDNQRRMWAAYYATVTFMDDQVGRILTELDRLGLRDNTAVIFTSDHGYHLGEHTFWQKGNLHEEVIRVPLIVSAPGYEPGRSAAITELVDIYPTVCELLDVSVPGSVQGKSLLPILRNPAATIRDGALSFAGKGRSLRTPDWAYMKYGENAEELYDMNADPRQFTNLAGEERYGAMLNSLRDQLNDRLAVTRSKNK